MPPTASWGGTERIEPGSSQRCTAAGREPVDTSQNKGNLSQTSGKMLSHKGGETLGQVPQGGCAVSTLGEGPEQPAQNWPCSGRGLDPMASSCPFQPK